MTIHALNDDVLREIFRAASSLRPRDMTSFRIMDVPIALSHVSSRWRSVALTTPSLWTTIQAPVPITPLRVEMIEACLTRSGAAPLNVEIRASGRRAQLAHTGTGRMPSPIFTRCNSLAITFAGHSDGHYYAQLAPTLHSLRLPSTLRLSELTISSTFMHVGDMPALCSLLQSCRLRHLSLHEIEFIETDTAVPIIWELPTLLTFHVYKQVMDDDLGGLDVLGIVNHNYRITTPSLHTLNIEAAFIDERQNLSAFQTVRRLNLRTESIAETHAAEMICALRALEELTLDVNIQENGIPSALSPPFLTHIDFCRSQDIDMIARFLVDGTTTSVIGAGSLNYVDLSRCPMSADLREWIAQRVPVVKCAVEEP